MMKKTYLLLFVFIMCTGFSCLSCKKDLSVDGDSTPIDSRLVAPWYNKLSKTGFEVLDNGATKTLVVDSLNTLQYLTAKDTIRYGNDILRLSVTVTKTESEDIYLKITYPTSGTTDSTFTTIGQYSISAANDTLHMNVDFLTGRSTNINYLRSTIGAVVP